MYQHVCFCSKANKDLVTLSIFSLALGSFTMDRIWGRNVLPNHCRFVANTGEMCHSSECALSVRFWVFFFESSSNFFFKKKQGSQSPLGPKKTHTHTLKMNNDTHTHTRFLERNPMCTTRTPRAPHWFIDSCEVTTPSICILVCRFRTWIFFCDDI